MNLQNVTLGCVKDIMLEISWLCRKGLLFFIHGYTELYHNHQIDSDSAA